jgi:hypothetical protein
MHAQLAVDYDGGTAIIPHDGAGLGAGTADELLRLQRRARCNTLAHRARPRVSRAPPSPLIRCADES